MSAFVEQIVSTLPRVPDRGVPLTLLAINAHGAPRWVLSDEGSALDAVFANWSPYRASSRFGWSAVRLAHRAGMLNALPRVETIDLQLRTAIDWQALGWNAGAPPVFAIYVGTSGPTQKAVLHLVNRSSRQCEAIVKVPLGKSAQDAIVREAQNLSSLTHGQRNRAPALLFLDRERGLAAQQFIPGTPGSRRLRAEYLELLRSLISADKSTALGEHATACQQALASCAGNNNAETLRAAMAALDDDRPLPACWVHGDFAPWNIRQHPGRPPALVDWEQAQPDGLPLHDAYHFLHIQDFLFGSASALHANALMDFAASLGLTPDQCRKLEIAYLTQTYLHCRSRDDASRSAYVLTTLANALEKYAGTSRPVPNPWHRPHNPASELQRRARADMLNNLITQLNRDNIAYCLLSGYDPSPDSGTPDLDLMVRAEDRRRIPELLMRTAQATGARLVQALQHETSATYFILARADAGQISHLDVDCYTDYRRDGRTWLSGADVIARRGKVRDFYVPAVADAFSYYLLKKVLKQSVTPHQLKRLQHLLARSPCECRGRIAQYWPARALGLERAIAEQDVRGFREQLPALYGELEASRPVQSFASRCWHKSRDLARRLRRAMHPTGMWLVVAGGELPQRIQIAEKLAERLAPVFRRTRVLAESPVESSVQRTMRILFARMRSTLVITYANANLPGSSASLRQRVIRRAQYALPPDLVIALDATQPAIASQAQRMRCTLRVNIATDSPMPVQSITKEVLQWLAARLRMRLRLRQSPSVAAEYDTSPHELTPLESE